ncbi:Flp pilus assembly protein CpaB [Vibrio aquaticus]|uniref:Flp pilus assembly protein CpaB n=1 Tax=Vibrio aquaticus TaxID=2496559 RepID=A0A3S0MI72_9VIBR|nr:Flp pilus assembly protein CpaB [Vibrio aquaticus]RTZ14456.1 Flp pilus assembly protein CpaB [Vibrio aquaticus]
MNSKIILGLAFVAISIGLYGVTNATPKQPTKPELPVTAEVSYKVWRLKHELAKGEKVTRTDLMIEHLPQAKAALVGIDEDAALDWEKSFFAVRDLTMGEIVTESVLTSPGDNDYLQTVLKPGFVPYNVTVPSEDVLGGTISVGDCVDISVLSAPKQNLSTQETVSDIQHLSMTPLLAQIPVLDMVSKEKSVSALTSKTATEVTLVLQVTNQQLAKLTVARRIAEIAVHHSMGEEYADDLQADSSDIIPVNSSSEGIREFRFE